MDPPTDVMMIGLALRVSRAAITEMFSAGNDPVNETATQSLVFTPASFRNWTITPAKLGFVVDSLESMYPLSVVIRVYSCPIRAV